MIMRKDVQLKFVLLMMLFVGAFMACDDDDEKIDVGNPDFVFNSETGEYNVRIGKEVALCVHVKDALNPVYAWKQEGKIVADDTCIISRGKLWASVLSISVWMQITGAWRNK